MEVHLVDGTYELFRQFFGQRHRSRQATDGTEVAATIGVLASVLTMLEEGATHIGVATDHQIESFRNDLWPGYKTGEGVDPALLAQFPLLEEALAALGVATFPMVELEADDALCSLATIAKADEAVERVLIWTPDKDLGQCVEGERVVQVDRRNKAILDEGAVRAKFGVAPASIPDWLALVGDSADGFPGLAGWGKQSAAVVLAHYGHLEAIPDEASEWDPGLVARLRTAPALALRLAEERQLAVLFRHLATLQVDSSLVAAVGELAWSGPDDSFVEMAAFLGAPQLLERAERLSAQLGCRESGRTSPAVPSSRVAKAR